MNDSGRCKTNEPRSALFPGNAARGGAVFSSKGPSTATVAPEGAAIRAATSGSASSAPLRTAVTLKTRIYIVDDHPLIRRGLAALIGGESDMEVCGQAEDASAGLQAIMKLQPEIVIVDISLRGNSGLELIKSIKAYNPKIFVLVLSIHNESTYALRALKAGARAYVMKQDVIDKVLQAIRRVRNGDLYVSDEVARQMVDRLAMGESFDASTVASLSDRELEIVNLIGSGLITRAIAVRLHVSIKTVETHRAHIKEKLQLQNATQLVRFCVQWVAECSEGNKAGKCMVSDRQAPFGARPLTTAEI